MVDTKNTNPTTTSSFLQKIGEQARTEGGAACLRAATRQFMKTAQVPLLGALQRRKVNIRALESFLQTPLGEGLFGIGLGLVLPQVPGIKGRLAETMGAELRVQGMASIVSEVSEVLLEPLREALAAAFVAETGD
ncbi:MAG TPA: hypothetical protein VM580_21625 [Labilithrix sp.]|nr:hypothetical protein [Labilithrix sp.]